MRRAHKLEIRVRYSECDPMGVAHHAVYPVWLEMGRTELLRETGTSYASLEEAGILLVVTRLNIRYRKPARYDEVLTLETTLTDLGHVKIEHAYQLLCGGDEIAVAETTLACVDRGGSVRELPANWGR
ncbi:MAG: acyl-CoA thioesterase [Phycisphaerales bacterium]|nr:acyl-CoA thioesterase [Phycisphaerales bacterium]